MMTSSLPLRLLEKNETRRKCLCAGMLVEILSGINTNVELTL
jgi:hypothetical protein